MAQHDFEIDNSTGQNVRIDINNVLKAILTNNAGSTDPATVIASSVGSKAYSFWADTNSSPAVLKIRNSADNAWIELFQLDGTLTLEDGSASAAGLGFRTDLDTGLFLNAAGELGITAAGVNRMLVTATKGVMIGTDTEGNASADNLTIGDSGNAGITIRSGSTSSGNVYFSDGTSGNAEFAGYLQYDHNSNKLYLGAGENNGIIVDGSTGSDVRVGINNTNVSALNASADDLVITKSANCGITVQSGSSNDGNIFFADGTSGNAQFAGYIQYNHTNDEMRLGSSADNAILIKNVAANRDVHLVSGDLVLDTAGRGIDFAAAGGSASGSTGSVLNDYEEGTWTPALTSGFFSGGTYNNQGGTYVKIGNILHAFFFIRFNALTTSGGDISINSPFTMLTGTDHKGIGVIGYHNLAGASTGGNTIAAYSQDASNVAFYAGAGTKLNCTAHQSQANAFFIGNFSVRCA